MSKNRSPIPISLSMAAICCVPLIEKVIVHTGDLLDNWVSLVVAVSGVILAIYQIHQVTEQRKRDADFALAQNRFEKAQKDSAKMISTLQLELSQTYLTPDEQTDSSDAGIAWRGLQASISDSAYIRFLKIYPDSIYKSAAESRRKLLNLWRSVDKDDPLEINNFLFTNPFTALRLEAQSLQSHAIESLAERRLRTFWSSIESYNTLVYVPLMFLAAILLVVMLSLFFQATSTDRIQPIIKGIVETAYVVFIWVAQFDLPSKFLDFNWSDEVATKLVRIAVTALMLLGCIKVATFVSKQIIKLWLRPHYDLVDSVIREQCNLDMEKYR